MKLQPRALRTLSTAALLACALAFSLPTRKAEAQTTARRAPTAESKQTGRKRAEEARRRADTREAVAVLLETAEAARSFDDLLDKVEVQAEAADILWPFDEPSARAILRRAWEATTAPGLIPAFEQESRSRDDAIDKVLTARRIVIARAVRHDARLAERYVKELMQGVPASDGEGASDDGEPLPREVWRRTSPKGEQMLDTAASLLYKGDSKSAALLAAPVVNEGVSRNLVDFIIALRAHAPREGDALYLRLLERTRADALANANDVLLLSQPIVSPHLQLFINDDGSAHLRPLDYVDETMYRAFADAPAEVRRAFYATAAFVLLRPLPEANGAASNPEASARFFTAGRLLPFFEREAPQFAPPLRARMSALSAEMASGRAESLSANMGTLSLTPKNSVDPLAPQLEELARTADAHERDRLRLRAVENAARHMLWDRARGVAAEIEDAEKQRDARRLITIYQVMCVVRSYDDETDDFERAADFVRGADVPPEFRAAGFAQAAELAARGGKSARAAALLDEALLFAGQAASEGGRRLTALTLVAQAATRVKAARTWEVLAALVRQANETEAPSEVNLHFEGGYYQDGGPTFSLPEEALNLEEPFAAAARLDFGRTLAEVRSLGDRLTRALVTVSVARAALEKGGDKPR